MSIAVAHRVSADQLRGPLRELGLPVDQMDDDAISSAALQLYGVGEQYAAAFKHLLPEGEKPGPRLTRLANFCEAIEGLELADKAAGETFRIEVSPPHQPSVIEEDHSADGIEEAAQIFARFIQPEGSPPMPLSGLVEELAQVGELRQVKADGRTVVARLVAVGERV